MKYIVQHVYVDTKDNLYRTVRESNTKKIIFSSHGDLPIRHPGSLRIIAIGSYHMSIFVDHRFQTQHVRLPISMKIFSPDGVEFTAGHVTVNDLNRFRDLRGVSQGTWRYAAFGDSGPIEEPIEGSGEPEFIVGPNPGHLWIAIDETLPSQSAGPLVDREISGAPDSLREIFKAKGVSFPVSIHIVAQEFGLTPPISIRELIQA
jgi:hypothetical protein